MVYATRIGDIDLLAVLDMVPPSYDPLEFFPGVSKEAWGAEAAHLVDGRLQLYYGCYALRGNGKTIMVDTGKGPGPHPDRGNRRGDLPGQLRLHGIDPSDVDLVVHTHLHHDHVGWNVTLGGSGEARSTFPKARHLVPRGDWEYFTRPDVLEQSPHVRDHVVALERLGIVDLIEGEHQLTPEVSTTPTNGHTPGHLNVVVSSGGMKAAIVGDMLHSMVQVGEPGWCSRADVDATQAEATRRAMLERFERESFVVAAGHFRPERQFGSLERREGRFHWRSQS